MSAFLCFLFPAEIDPDQPQAEVIIQTSLRREWGLIKCIFAKIYPLCIFLSHFGAQLERGAINPITLLLNPPHPNQMIEDNVCFLHYSGEFTVHCYSPRIVDINLKQVYKLYNPQLNKN